MPDEFTRSILDRLIDEDPQVPREPYPRFATDLAGHREAVRRDLELLLNSRCPLSIGEDRPEASRSVLAYGLPDLSTVNLADQEQRDSLCRRISEAVRHFEPRLQRVRVSLAGDGDSAQRLVFKIEGLLRVEPAPEPVQFDTELEFCSGSYLVQEAEDAG